MDHIRCFSQLTPFSRSTFRLTWFLAILALENPDALRTELDLDIDRIRGPACADLFLGFFHLSYLNGNMTPTVASKDAPSVATSFSLG